MLEYNHKITMTLFEVGMKLGEIADVRTGAVIARLKKDDGQNNYKYKILSLKCIDNQGRISDYFDEIETGQEAKEEFLTKKGDILVRLSVPYTATLIDEKNESLLIPSHFAIIRPLKNKATSQYIYWLLNRDNVQKQIQQNKSGGTIFGTISSGFFNDLEIREVSIEKQKVIGQLIELSMREQQILERLLENKKRYNKLLITKFYNEIKRGK